MHLQQAGGFVIKYCLCLKKWRLKWDNDLFHLIYTSKFKNCNFEKEKNEENKGNFPNFSENTGSCCLNLKRPVRRKYCLSQFWLYLEVL